MTIHPTTCRCGGTHLGCDSVEELGSAAVRVAAERISIGIAWLVIVAAEMLVGGTGIGYFVWNQWNNLAIADIAVAILVIGLVGMALDLALGRTARAIAWRE